MYDDSEDSLGISSSDSEEEDQDITYAQFKKRDYAKISKNLKVGDYYGCDAKETIKSRDQFWVGRISKLNKTSVDMKFLAKTRKVPNQYDWPVRDDTLEEIDPKGLFVGQLRMRGTCPFIIMQLDEAYEAYQAHTSN